MLEQKNIGLFRNAFLHAVKFPIIYLMLGITLVTLSDIDKVFPITEWKQLFDITDKVGDMFISFAVATFIYSMITRLCLLYELKFATTRKITAHILSSVRKGARIIYALMILHIAITFADPTRFYLVLANNILSTIIIGSVGWIAIQILYTLETVLYQYMMGLTNSDHLRAKALYTKLHIMKNIATVVIVIVTIAAILMSFSSVRNIGISLLASAGFLTALLGLAAQKGLFSIFSGLQIALSQPIKIGDIVVIDNVNGTVEEITFTYVTLRLGDSRRMVVPINYFVEKPFENWSREGETLRSNLHFYVDYMTPIEPIRAELNRILQHSKYWDGQAAKLQVSDLTERAVEIRIQVGAANADDSSDLRAEVREKILAYIRNNFPDHFPKFRLNDSNPIAVIETQ